jgi:hypothetical protein
VLGHRPSGMLQKVRQDSKGPELERHQLPRSAQLIALGIQHTVAKHKTHRVDGDVLIQLIL